MYKEMERMIATLDEAIRKMEARITERDQIIDDLLATYIQLYSELPLE